MAANFAMARAAATNLLLTQRLYSVKINVLTLKYSKDIIFDTYEHFCTNSKVTIDELYCIGNSQDALTIIKKNTNDTQYIVLYNDKIMSAGRRSFSLAHEIGHIYLDHQDDGADNEAEANCFAAEFILPRVLANELFARSNFCLSPDVLADIFGTSRKAAENRVKSLTKNYTFTTDEQKLLHKLSGLLPHFDGPQIDC